jgi:predicted transcriptional regulator
VSCPTCTELRRKIRALQIENKRLAKKAETPWEKQARMARLRAGRAKIRARKKAAPAPTPPTPTE